MRAMFTAGLVNGVWGDPGLCIDLRFQRRALLFDIGDVTSLSTRVLLRVSDIFVSHTHMDHFAGFDHLLRVCLGRDTGVRMYGPPGFIAQVGHKLAAYTWNLTANYASDFVIEVHEVHAEQRMRRSRFRSQARFEREDLEDVSIQNGALLEDEQFVVRTQAFQHHDIVSLGFSFEERVHINVWKTRLEALRLPTGPWLTELKKQVRSGAPDDLPILIRWRTRDGSREETLPLGKLKREVLEFVPGQKVCYVTDVEASEGNRSLIVDLVRGADLLFIEAVFREADTELAARKAHLTTRQAGQLARSAGVKRAEPFHFSARYRPDADGQRNEFMKAWHGD